MKKTADPIENTKTSWIYTSDHLRHITGNLFTMLEKSVLTSPKDGTKVLKVKVKFSYN